MEKTKILIVEDEAIIANDLKTQLGALGYDTSLTASTGEEAVYTAMEFKPDLVLMDIALPGEIDGIEAAHRIRSRSHVPIIYLTAYVEKETIERAKLTEPFGYLLKPFRGKELQITIEMTLHKYRMERKLKEEYKELDRNKHYLLQLIHDLKEANEQMQREMSGQNRTEERNSLIRKESEIVAQELNEFTYIISKKLQVPLNAIITLANWLSSDHSDKLNEEGKEELQLLVNSANLMRHLINDILHYLKVRRTDMSRILID